MTPLTLLLMGLLFAAATVFAMFGQGGGAVYTPLQVLFGVPFQVAAATSLFLIMIGALASLPVYHRARLIDWPLALTLEAAAMTGSFGGGLVSDRFPSALLTVAFAALIGIAAVVTLADVRLETCARLPSLAGRFCWERAHGDSRYRVNLLVGLPLAGIAGFASGLLGIGGGLFLVPLMVLVLNVPIRIAIGSSALMVGLTAAAGFGGHLLAGHWDWRASLLFAGAVFLGARLGAHLTTHIDKHRIQPLFGGFLLALAGLLVLRILAS